MATQAVETAANDPYDLSSAALYAEDRWQQPARRARAEAPIHFVSDSHFGSYWSVAT